MGEIARRMAPVPTHHGFVNSWLVGCIGNGDLQTPLIVQYRGYQNGVGDNVEGEVVAQESELFAVRPALFARFVTGPFVEFSDDPCGAIGHRFADSRVGCIPRRRDDQAVAIDAKGDAAAASAALQNERHVTLTETRGLRLRHHAHREKVGYEWRALPSRSTSCSTQCSTSLISSSGLRKLASSAGPMLTVIVPGYLIKSLRPHTVPALCATGMTLAPICAATQAPPI